MAKFSSVNQLPATGPAAIYIVKETLVDAGWVVIGSGDGLALYSAAGDIITTGAAGAGGLGQANAWFAIRDAATRVAFTFQMVTNTTWRVKYTETGAFSGGTPGISRTGTATDEQVLYGAGTDAAPTGTQLLYTDAGYRFHVVANSTAQSGSGTYPFWFGCTVSGTGVCASLFALEGMLAGTYNALDIAPRVILTWYTAVGPVTTGWSDTTDGGLYTRGWVAKGLAGASFARQAIASYWLDRTAAASTYHTGLGMSASGSLMGGGASNYGEIADVPMPLFFGRIALLGTPYGPKGFSADIKMATYSARAYPSTILNTTNAYVYYGGLLLAWPESVSPSL